MTAIIDVYARQILDSRGNPTVEVESRGRRQHGTRGGPIRRLHRRPRSR